MRRGVERSRHGASLLLHHVPHGRHRVPNWRRSSRTDWYFPAPELRPLSSGWAVYSGARLLSYFTAEARLTELEKGRAAAPA